MSTRVPRRFGRWSSGSVWCSRMAGPGPGTIGAFQERAGWASTRTSPAPAAPRAGRREDALAGRRPDSTALGGPARRRASGGRGGWARLGRWSRVGRAISLRRLDEVRLRVLHGAGPGREGGEVQRRGPVVVPGARRAEGNLVSVTKELLASDALAVDVRTVEAPEDREAGTARLSARRCNAPSTRSCRGAVSSCWGASQGCSPGEGQSPAAPRRWRGSVVPSVRGAA